MQQCPSRSQLVRVEADRTLDRASGSGFRPRTAPAIWKLRREKKKTGEKKRSVPVQPVVAVAGRVETRPGRNHEVTICRLARSNSGGFLGPRTFWALWQKRRRALPSVRELDQLHRPAPTALSGGNSQPRHERTRIDGHQIVVVFSVRSCRLWYYRCKTYLELFAGHEPSTPKRLQFSTSTKQVISGDSLPAVTEILQLGANACGVRQ
jgi:hypothetical protein